MNVATSPHVLLVGGGGGIPGMINRLAPAAGVSVMCRPKSIRHFPDLASLRRLVMHRQDSDVVEWIRSASNIHARDPFTSIGSLTDPVMGYASAVAVALGLPFHSQETSRAVDDKLEMRRLLAGAGVAPVPAAAVRDASDVLAVADRFGYPLILKPVRGTASRGVSRIDGPGQVREALEWSLAGQAPGGPASLMVERFVRGREFSVECFSEAGVHVVCCLTAKSTDPDHFVEVGHALPASVSPAMAERVLRTVGAALTALGVRQGATHTEIIIDDDTGSPHIVETHLRPGGDEIPRLLSRAQGIDLLELTVRQWLGDSVLPTVERELSRAPGAGRCAAIWFITPSRPGIVKEISGVETVSAMPGVCEVAVAVQPGNRVDALRSSDDRLGYVFATGASPGQASKLARRAAERVEIAIEGAEH